jgi:hypothetical protein
MRMLVLCGITVGLTGVTSFQTPFLSCRPDQKALRSLRWQQNGNGWTDMRSRSMRPLFMSLVDPDTKEKKNSNKQKKSTIVGEDSDADKPLQPVGTQFFGGSMEKEIFFDEAIEDEATKIALSTGQEAGATAVKTPTAYARFEDSSAFPDERAKALGERLQSEFNAVLYEDAGQSSNYLGSLYSNPSMQWVSPFGDKKSATSPLKELQRALNYYNRLDASIMSVKFVSDNTCDVRWMTSVVWPNAWEARVAMSGTSTLTLNGDGSKITKQVDRIDNGGDKGTDLLNALSGQVNPRFWDFYHVGMTPSAEEMQRLPPSGNTKKGALSSYSIFEIAPRLVVKPCMLDSGGRAARAAQCIPNHGFSCAIKTAGPRKQRYVPTVPLEVRINKAEGGSRITWVVPVPAETASSSSLLLPVLPEGTREEEASTSYEYEPARRVATLPFGGYAQDEGISKVRQGLYESVMRDGLSPKLDSNDRPKFFFLQNNAKCCFTEEGLGMAVYEARPDFLKTNEVGIELEM